MQKAVLVTSLHGNTYEVVRWRLYLHFPLVYNSDISYSREVISNDTALFIKSIHGIEYMAKYNYIHRYWVLFKLKFKDYNELKDIRKSYLHGNIYHS